MTFWDHFARDVKILFSGDTPLDKKVRGYLETNDINLGSAIFHSTYIKAERVQEMIESGRVNELLKEAKDASKRYELYKRWLSFVQPYATER